MASHTESRWRQIISNCLPAKSIMEIISTIQALACVDMKSIHDTAGRRQEVACLLLDAVPVWLARPSESRRVNS
jgi:hypothetical protein